MQVLAASGDPFVLSILVRCLRKWGDEVTTATSGAEASRVLNQGGGPRMVVLDREMPDVSGLELLCTLRALPHGDELYVLVLGECQSKAGIVEALEAGADDFLSKPLHPRELQLRLAKRRPKHGAESSGSRTSGGGPTSGMTLAGKYRLERKIGEGGMATVWLATHLSLGVPVALKFMKRRPGDAPEPSSFEREARAAARLRSIHSVRVYDHGVSEGGMPYLVMEYLPGVSLAARIDDHGPVALREVASIVEQIARVLTEAHSVGIIHADVKPENILLVSSADRPHGCASLVDFGLACSRVPRTPQRRGSISGTPGYMSPEHLRGQAVPNVALDTWGLAAAAFTALTGAVPFDGASVTDIARNVCLAPLPIPSHYNRTLPPEVDAWFARACSRLVEERFQTPRELADALARCVAGHGRREAGSTAVRGRARMATEQRVLRPGTLGTSPQLDSLSQVAA